MGALLATALSSAGEAVGLSIAGVAVSVLAGLLGVFAAYREREALQQSEDAASGWAWAGRQASEDEEDERPGLQRRAQAQVLPPVPVLTVATVRSVIREELAVIREDIKRSGRRTFWYGFGQGLLFYLCGVGVTLLISG